MSTDNLIIEADFLRAITATTNSLEVDDMPLDEFVNCLEALADVADGIITHNQFIKKVNIKDISYS